MIGTPLPISRGRPPPPPPPRNLALPSWSQGRMITNSLLIDSVPITTAWHFCSNWSTISMWKLHKPALWVVFDYYTICVSIYRWLRHTSVSKKLSPMLMNRFITVNSKPHHTRSSALCKNIETRQGINSFVIQGARTGMHSIPIKRNRIFQCIYKLLELLDGCFMYYEYSIHWQ